jgi:hypothetical protein
LGILKPPSKPISMPPHPVKSDNKFFFILSRFS